MLLLDIPLLSLAGYGAHRIRRSHLLPVADMRFEWVGHYFTSVGWRVSREFARNATGEL